MNKKARQSGEQYVEVVHYGSHAVTSPQFPNESVNQSSGSRLFEYCAGFLGEFSTCSRVVHNGSLFTIWVTTLHCTASLHHCITASLHHCITASLHHCITAYITALPTLHCCLHCTALRALRALHCLHCGASGDGYSAVQCSAVHV